MFGWINDCTECLVVSKFGEETWHKIKEKANCNVVDGGFLRYKYYPDSDTVELVVAASEVLGVSVDDVLFAFGDYFIDYVQDNGYSNVLECLGSNMRDWLANLNSLHDHLQASYPKGFIAPVFWSEDDPDSSTEAGAILVYYYSQRGSLLVPLVVGVLKKIALAYFEIEINLEQIALQDEVKEGLEGEEDGDATHKQTIWRVTAVDPEEARKLRGKKRSSRRNRDKSKDDGTVTTLATAASNTSTVVQNRYKQTFREGGVQASVLRVKELVQRCFFRESCDLYHALTQEQYMYLVEFWKNANLQKEGDAVENINGYTGLLCYEMWALDDDDPTSWPTLKDLPPLLNSDTLDRSQFGGKVPTTGAYPPDEDGALQSFPPIIRVTNTVDTDKSVDLTFSPQDNDFTMTLEQQIAPKAAQSGITNFDPEIASRIDAAELEVQWVIWDKTAEAPYHTFTQGDLSITSLQQFFDLITGANLDPVNLRIQLTEAETLDDDEEDI